MRTNQICGTQARQQARLVLIPQQVPACAKIEKKSRDHLFFTAITLGAHAT